MTILLSFVAAVAGAMVSSVLSCVPGLHIYNVLGFLVLWLHGAGVPPEATVPFFAGLVVGYSLLNTVPSVLLAAPDESALFTVLPGQKYLMAGRGYEGVMITAAGGLGGILLLVGVAGPLAPLCLPTAQAVFAPHAHWIVWCVIAFLLQSEWPKEQGAEPEGWSKLKRGWRSTGAGLLTFVLSGLLGFILMYRSPFPAELAFQNLMPAFVGLFTLPWLVLNILSRVAVPAQTGGAAVRLDRTSLAWGTAAGWLGGAFAAFFPVVSGGVGGLLAGHATALRDNRAFLVSQGTSKTVYYVGSFLLLFVPGLGLTRGGAAWMLRGLYVPRTQADYFLVLGAIAVAGATAFLMVGPMTRLVVAGISRSGYRRISVLSLVLAVGVVWGMMGWRGLAVMAVAGAIGMVPVLYGSRRLNCLGVILLPMACNLSGVGVTVAGWLGLV